ncbi:MAG: DUF2799 domain-containing protein [Hyphomonas sp.]
MRLLTTGLALGACLTMAACASSGPKYNADQCASIDWHAMGVADGQKGENPTALNDEISQCSAFGVSVDKEQYNAGREEGLKTYCQPSVLIDATVQSVGDPFSCQPFTDVQKSAFETGRDTKAAVARYQQFKAQYDQLLQAKEQINTEGNQLTARYQQTQDETTRNQIKQRIQYLREQLQLVNAKLEEADPTMKTEEAAYQGAVKSYEAFKAGLAQ